MLTYSSLSRSASCSAAVVTWRRRAEKPTCEPPCARGSRFELGAHRGGEAERIRVHLADDLRDDAFVLLDERQQQVLGQDLGMSFALGELLRGEDRFLCFLGVLVDVHDLLVQFRQRLVVLSLLLRASGGAASRRSRTDRRGRRACRRPACRGPSGGRPGRSASSRESSAARDPVIVGTCASPPSTAVVTGTRDLRVEVVALALEDRVRPQSHAQIQIAGGAAVRAGFALAGGAHARAVLDAGRESARPRCARGRPA